MDYIRVNDIFDELIDENQRLKECLKVLIEYKNFVNLVINKLNSGLDFNDSNNLKEVHKNVDQVLKTNNLVHRLESKQDFRLKLNNVKSIGKRLTKGGKGSKKYPDTGRVPWSRINGMFVCGFIGCGKEYALKTGLEYHLTTHRKRLVCDYEGCSYRTGSHKNLKYHKNVHKEVKPFQCHICPKALSSKQSLLSHIESVHKRYEEPLICGIDNCSKVFDTEFRLKIHQNNKHLKEKRFSCDFPNCDFRSVSKTFLNVHQLCHSEERPFICEFDGCAMTFKTKNAMSNHITTHSTERNFECLFDGCDKKFKTKVTLNRHISSVHSGIRHYCNWPGCEFETNCPRTLNTHRVVHSTERNFHCDWPQCYKSFKKKIDLTHHLRIHRNERRYACSWPGCQYRCVFGGNLSKHMKTHQK